MNTTYPLTVTLAVLLTFSPATLLAQDEEPTTEKTQSKTEAFYSASGTLFERQYHPVGKLRTLTIQRMEIRNLSTNEEVRALRFESPYSISQYSSDTKIAVVDKDEVQGLLNALRIMRDQVLTSTRDVYTEVTFTSRSGLQAGCYYDEGKKKWTGYVRVDKYHARSVVYFDATDLATLLSLIESAGV
jgi:hypothetical protein